MRALSAGYGRLFRVPHTKTLVATVWVASLPMGLYTVTILLFVRAHSGSLGFAGVVAGAFGLGVALGGPPQGRLTDSLGPFRVMLVSAALHVAGFAALWFAVVFEWEGAVVPIAGALVAGAAMPRIASVARTLWPRVLARDPSLLPRAYALDASSLESLYIVGPVLASVFAALDATAVLLAGAILLMPLGTVWFLVLPPMRHWRPPPCSQHLLGALAAPGVRVLLFSAFAIGILFGATEVALLAFADAHGSTATGAILITGFSIGSVIAAIAYGGSALSADAQRAYLLLVALAPVADCLLLAGWSIPSMFALTLLAGAGLAPLFAAESQIISEIAPAGTATEAFTWIGSAIFAGFAAGTSLAGLAVDATGWRGGIFLAAAAVAVAAAVAFATRRHLSPVAS